MFKDILKIKIIIIAFFLISKTSLASIDDYEEVFKQHFIDNNIPKTMHESFKKCAYYYLMEFNPEIAIPNCELLLDLTTKKYGSNDYQVIELHFYLGDMYFRIQNFSKALEYIKYALPINEELYPQNIYNTILGHNVLINVYVSKLERDKALLSVNKLLLLLANEKNSQAFDDVFYGLPTYEIKLNLLMYGLSALSSNYDNVVAEKYLSEAKIIIDQFNFEINNYAKVLYYNNYGLYLSNNKKLEQALQEYKKALNLADQIAKEWNLEFSPDLHPNLWGNIALLYTNLGEYKDARDLLKKAEKKIINIEGEKSVTLFINYHNQGSNFLNEGNLNQAILYFNKALNIAEYYHDFSEKTKIQTLINLAATYLRAGDTMNANSIDIKISKLLTKDDYIMLQLDYKKFKSELLQSENKYDEATNLINEIIKQSEVVWGPNSLQVAENLHRLTMNYYFLGDTEQIIKYGKQTLERFKFTENSMTSDFAEIHIMLGEAYHLLYIQSLINNTNIEEHYTEAFFNFNEAYNYFSLRKDQTFNYVQNINLGSGLLHLKNDFKRAHEMDKEILDMIVKVTQIKNDENYKQFTKSIIQKSYQSILQDTLGRTIDVWMSNQDNFVENYEFRNHAFKIAQLINANKIDNSLHKMSLRVLAQSKELEELIFNKSQNNIQIENLSITLNKLKTGEVENRNIDKEENILNSIKKLENNNEKIDIIINNQHNNYLNVTNNNVYELEELYDNLDKDEALLYFVSDISATASFLIKNDGIWEYRSDKDINDFSNNINKLRNSLNLLDVYSYDDLEPFPIESSQNIYKEIIEPFESQLENVEHLFIVPTGKLHSIPFAALVDNSFDDLMNVNYDQLPWLINSHSISILPSVNSLKIFRSVNQKNNETQLETFVGIGNPKFRREKNNISEIEISFNQLFSKGALADVKLINDFAELPETEKELRLMGNNFKENKRIILTREEANESKIKSMDLSKSDVIVFSTHAVINGEIENDEPGLILSPPLVASEENDGILTMSEILSLKLNADFVILSACNTASGENNYSEPLSGLARAFFFAGAKSLLVSNWAVESQSTFELTTTMFDNLRNKNVSRSEALRNSMRALINNEENEYYSHPVFWAPFILIGDR